MGFSGRWRQFDWGFREVRERADQDIVGAFEENERLYGIAIQHSR